MPKMTKYLPIPPHRQKNYYFPYECLRLICERLYGVIDCYSQYSRDIPRREYDDEDLEVVVTKVMIDLEILYDLEIVVMTMKLILCFKINWYTFRGSNSTIFIFFCFPSEWR